LLYLHCTCHLSLSMLLLKLVKKGMVSEPALKMLKIAFSENASELTSNKFKVGAMLQPTTLNQENRLFF
jgi:hypothetical protein